MTVIRPGTQAAQGMTDADIAKRTKLEQIKRLKLQNINVFVSPTRLAIQNLPKYVDDKMLREAVLKAVDDKKARIIEVSMRSLGVVKVIGVFKVIGGQWANIIPSISLSPLGSIYFFIHNINLYPSQVLIYTPG